MRLFRGCGFAILLTVLFSLSSLAVAQQEQPSVSSCSSGEVVVATDRPTYSNGADTMPCGVLTITGGLERAWSPQGVHQDDSAEGLHFGLTRSIDLHYTGNVFYNLGSGGGGLTGLSDSYFAVRSRFWRQSRHVPAISTFYTIKIPTGNVASGMSTGRYDHTLSFLVSKDLAKVHLDFNLTPQMIGTTGASAFAHNTAVVLFSSLPLNKNLTFVGGVYGLTSLNASNPAYAVSTVGFTWQLSHLLILDISADQGLTDTAPKHRLGVGFTYAPANLYRFMRSRQQNR